MSLPQPDLVLFSEIEHRTANSFQLMVGILSTQESQSSSMETRDALKLAAERIIRIGEMHAHLSFRTSDPGLVDFSVYLRRLCQQMVESLSAEPGRVRVDVEIEDEANWRPNVVIPFGLIAGEALTNAFIVLIRPRTSSLIRASARRRVAGG